MEVQWVLKKKRYSPNESEWSGKASKIALEIKDSYLEAWGAGCNRGQCGDEGEEGVQILEI